MNTTAPITDRIRAVREMCGLSVRAMATRMRMSPSGYIHYESPDRFKDDFLPMKIALTMVEATRDLGMNPKDIMELAGSGAPIPQQNVRAGMSEDAIPFVLPDHPANPADPNHLLRRIFGSRASTPATFSILQSLPAFALLAGDVLLCDMSRAPRPGEIAIVSVIDDQAGIALTTLRRFAPPFLLDGDFSAQPPMRIDDPGVMVRYPVVGTLRGISEKPQT